MNVIREITINDLPIRKGQINYIVPRYTIVLDSHGKRYANNGDHIHGIRDRGGVSTAVFPPQNCPYCDLGATTQDLFTNHRKGRK